MVEMRIDPLQDDLVDNLILLSGSQIQMSHIVLIIVMMVIPILSIVMVIKKHFRETLLRSVSCPKRIIISGQYMTWVITTTVMMIQSPSFLSVKLFCDFRSNAKYYRTRNANVNSNDVDSTHLVLYIDRRNREYRKRDWISLHEIYQRNSIDDSI